MDEEFKRPDIPALNGFEHFLMNCIEDIDSTYGNSYWANDEYNDKDLELYHKGVALAREAVQNYCRIRRAEINSSYFYRPRTMLVETDDEGNKTGRCYMMARCLKCNEHVKWYSPQEQKGINKCPNCNHEFIGDVKPYDW